MLASVAFAAPPDGGSVQAELDAMRAELRAIRAQRGEAWLDERRAAEVRALVQDVLADSSTRASFAGDAPMTGYDRASSSARRTTACCCA